MARARLLKPGFFTNEDLCEIPAFGRLLFAGLWTLADKAGRLDDRPKRIKAELFPYDAVNVPALMDKLEERGFIKRYTVGDAKLIQIVAFDKHQHPHKNEPASVLPDPNGECVGAESDIVRTEPDISETRPAVAVAVAVTEAETVAEANTEAVADTADEPPAHPFSVLYSQKFRERTKAILDGARHGRCLSLEQEFGAELCIQVATEKGWDKHPNYYVDVLKERVNGKQPVPVAAGIAAEYFGLKSKYDD